MEPAEAEKSQEKHTKSQQSSCKSPHHCKKKPKEAQISAVGARAFGQNHQTPSEQQKTASRNKSVRCALFTTRWCATACAPLPPYLANPCMRGCCVMRIQSCWLLTTYLGHLWREELEQVLLRKLLARLHHNARHGSLHPLGRLDCNHRSLCHLRVERRRGRGGFREKHSK